MDGLLNSYVPRHKRLGVCAGVPDIQPFADVVESVPVLEDDGTPVRIEYVHRTVPVEDVMSQFRLSHFRLSTMIENGVPLKVVNINRSKSMDIAQLERICESVDGAERFVQKSLEYQKELQSFFNPENAKPVEEPDNE